ncbi:hypothetical protein [Lysobacter sp. D1-1-M9]|uniref:hypothetical protein n=1 Tax=Novilysobacter longmucuonensis TaxID=3098603 RepID=UPI003983A633
MAAMPFDPRPANRNRAAGVLLHRARLFRDLSEELAPWAAPTEWGVSLVFAGEGGNDTAPP